MTATAGVRLRSEARTFPGAVMTPRRASDCTDMQPDRRFASVDTGGRFRPSEEIG